MGPGGLWWTNVLNLALSPQRFRPDTQPEHLDPASHLAQKKKKGKERKKGRKEERKEGRKEGRKDGQISKIK